MKRKALTAKLSKQAKRARAPIAPIPRPLRAPTGELKFFDTIVAGTALAITGVITSPSLNLVPQGITESQRIGRKITIKGITIRFLTQFNNGTAQTGEVLRIMVVHDKQNNGAAAAVTITDVLETASEGSFNNLANKSRFTTLMDVYKPFNKITDIGTNINEFLDAWVWHKDLNMPIEFDNSFADGRISTIRSSNILVFGLTLNSTTVNLGYTARIRFTDGL